MCVQVSARGDAFCCSSMAHNPGSLVRSYVPKFETLGFGQCLVWLGLVLLGLSNFG